MEVGGLIGRQIGQYRILSLVGSGGFADVFLAEDVRPQINRRVALKVLRPDLTKDDSFRRRFLRESLLASRLTHPNILAVHDAGEDQGLLYIAMPYVDGSDLRNLLDRHGALDVQRTTTVVTAVASALDSAHAAGVVHRDIKPANVLITGDFAHVSVADFGLTKELHSVGQQITAGGDVLGTLSYMAPEQIAGKTDHRTDVYALGCMLVEMLTGRPPFETDFPIAVLEAHRSHPPPSVTQRRPDLPEPIDEVVRHALAKSPDARYQTAGQLAEAVATALGPAPPTQFAPPQFAVQPFMPQPFTPRPPAPPRRSRLPAVVLASLLALASVGGLGAWLLRARDAGFPNAVEQALLDALPNPLAETCARAPDADGASATVACDPSGAPEEVLASRYPSTQGAEDAYEGHVEEMAVTASTGDCADTARAEHAYTTAGSQSGRVLCGTAGEQSQLVWRQGTVVASAVAAEADSEDLYRWWADFVDREIIRSDAEELRDDIADLVPGSCDPEMSGDELAGLRCIPETAVPFETLHRRYDTAAQLSANYRSELDDAALPDGFATTCEVADTAESAWLADGAEAGRLLCYDGGDGSRIVWTDLATRTLHVGFGDADDAEALHTWWSQVTGGELPEGEAPPPGCRGEVVDLIGMGTGVTGEITVDTPIAAYCVDAPAGQPLVLSLVALDPDLDPVLTLLDPDGAVLDSNDDAVPGEVLGSRLIISELPVDGRYEVRAASFGGTTGRFLLTPADAVLLSRVPLEMLQGCALDNPESTYVGELTSVRCAADGVPQDFVYVSFDDVQSLRDAYAVQVDGAVPTDSGAGCSSGVASEGTWGTRDGPDRGRLACYDVDGGSHVAWTDEEQLILAVAFSDTLFDTAFYDWWTLAGPLAP